MQVVLHHWHSSSCKVVLHHAMRTRHPAAVVKCNCRDAHQLKRDCIATAEAASTQGQVGILNVSTLHAIVPRVCTKHMFVLLMLCVQSTTHKCTAEAQQQNVCALKQQVKHQLQPGASRELAPYPQPPSAPLLQRTGSEELPCRP